MLVKSNFIAISGGPGSGKTTLLNLLSKEGFIVVSETGRQVIKERLADNLTPRPSPAVFADEMFKRDLKNFIDHLQVNSLVFFDRTFLDSAALLHEADHSLFENIKDFVENHRFNNNVFLAPPWKEIYANDEERDQSFEDAKNTYSLLFNWYEKKGYKVFQLPITTVENRAAFILDILALKSK